MENQNNLITALEEALVHANIATEADAASNVKQALTSYEMAANALEAIYEKIPEERRQAVLQYRDMYRKRAAELSLGSSTTREPPSVKLHGFEFVEMDVSSENAIEKAPANIHRRPFWLLKLLQKTMTTGGFLTPRVYVPRLIWYQEGGKVHGMGIKITVFETILENVAKLQSLPEPSSSSAILVFHHALDEFVKQLCTLQNSLARQFSFISEVTVEGNGMTVKSPTKRGITKFTNMAVGLGRMVKNQALTAVERVGVVAPSSHPDIPRYLELACSMCEQVQIFDVWLSTATEGSIVPGTDDKDYHTGLAVLKHQSMAQQVQRISHFMLGVVCEFLMRDLKALLTRYITKTSKTFAEVQWDY